MGWNADDTEFVRRQFGPLFAAGLSDREVALARGVCVGTARNYRHRLGLPARHHAGSAGHRRRTQAGHKRFAEANGSAPGRWHYERRRLLALDQGWPAGATPELGRNLELFERHGPLTAAAWAELAGRNPRRFWSLRRQRWVVPVGRGGAPGRRQDTLVYDLSDDVKLGRARVRHRAD